LPRTGTSSLKKAISMLTGVQCFHGSLITELHDEEYDFWLRALDNERRTKIAPDEWRKIFRNYGATLDLPSILFYKELMVAFPKAKVILTDREPTSWFESWWKSIGMELEGMEKRNGSLQRAITNMRFNPKMTLMHVAARSYVPDWWKSTNSAISGMTIDQAFGSLDSALSFYDAWKADVIRSVPPERLLIFDVKAGWEPLCKFLGCEVPASSVPFPCLNKASDVQRRIAAQDSHQRTVKYYIQMGVAAVVVTSVLSAVCYAATNTFSAIS